MRDAALYFGVYRVLSNGEPAPYQDHGTNPFYISTLVKQHEPHMNMRFIDEMDPYDPDLPRILDEKISANAQLLRKYGKDILAGHQWYDRIQKKLIPETIVMGGLNSSPANVLTSARRSTTTGQSIDSNKPLPMWVWLLIVGGISLCIGTALVFAFWSLLRS